MTEAKLEVACFNLASALIADEGGADRIELCDDFSAGGITPNYSSFETARKKITKDIFVMIRSRGGNFTYTKTAFEKMQSDILYFKQRQADGFVFGILNEDLSINKEQNKLLVELAYPLPCTFHRAFDRSGDFGKNLEDVIACGFKTILTSGHTQSAIHGIAQLKTLIQKSKNRIQIMPGGGIRSSNISILKSELQTTYLHSSAIIKDDLADIHEVQLLKEKLNEK
jgi:copper homeostasis protein